MNKTDSNIIDAILQDVSEGNRLSNQQAIDLYTKKLFHHPKSALLYCARGKIYNDIKDFQASKADYKAALAVIDKNEAEDIQAEKIPEAAEAIQQIIDLQEISILRNEVLSEIEAAEFDQQTKSKLQNTRIWLQDLDRTQGEYSGHIWSYISNSNTDLSNSKGKSNSLLSPIPRRDFEAFKKETKEMLNQMRQDLQQLKEANQQKLNDYSEMLDQALVKSQMSEPDQEKIKNYYNAFTSTFNSVFIASQAIDNGTIKFATEVEKLDLLTLAISFIPVAGDSVARALEITAQFVNNAIVINKARIIASIANGPVQLDQIVGGAAYSISIDEEKQTRILNPLKEESDKAKNMFEKIANFIKKKSKEIDTKLYGNKYDTFEKRLGHLDASFLINKYLSSEIKKPDLHAKFASEVLKSYDLKQLDLQQESKKRSLHNCGCF